MAGFENGELALEWLRGEDLHQWRRGEQGEFPIENDIRDLRIDGEWDRMLASYWSRSLQYRGENLSPQTVQYTGKLAAGCRAMFVALTVHGSPVPAGVAFNFANPLSFDLLEMSLSKPKSKAYDEWKAEDLGATMLGRSVASIHLPPSNKRDEFARQVHMAKLASENGMQMLAGVITEALRSGVGLPTPGLPSGPVPAWTHSAK